MATRALTSSGAPLNFIASAWVPRADKRAGCVVGRVFAGGSGVPSRKGNPCPLCAPVGLGPCGPLPHVGPPHVGPPHVGPLLWSLLALWYVLATVLALRQPLPAPLRRGAAPLLPGVSSPADAAPSWTPALGQWHIPAPPPGMPPRHPACHPVPRRLGCSPTPRPATRHADRLVTWRPPRRPGPPPGMPPRHPACHPRPPPPRMPPHPPPRNPACRDHAGPCPMRPPAPKWAHPMWTRRMSAAGLWLLLTSSLCSKRPWPFFRRNGGPGPGRGRRSRRGTASFGHEGNRWGCVWRAAKGRVAVERRLFSR
jgi:hypothetical protein